jgi:uncharacterized 2Fe-2S/4Fe-4S cluster protein (DUF4445 family)
MISILTLRVFFNPINKEFEANEGDNLLEAMRESEIRIESLCGGKGKCGKCKVVLEEGNVKKISKIPDKFLSTDEIENKYYLACMVELIEDCVFTIPAESRIIRPKILLSSPIRIEKTNPSIRKYLIETISVTNEDLQIPHKIIKLKNYFGLNPQIDDEFHLDLQRLKEEETLTATISMTSGLPEIIDVESGDRRDRCFGLALDIGTTTIVGLLVNLQTGEIIKEASTLNKQITYGEEVVTRIAFAYQEKGLHKLQISAVDSINEIVEDIIGKSDLNQNEIKDVCVGGNTVMNHIFAGIDPTYLEMANTEVSKDPIILRAKKVGLNVLPESYVYCLPNVSRFLGGDAVGDVIASNMHRSKDLSLMVDLGTNGEVVFGNNSWLFSCSCASGPAFEGEGVRHGMRGSDGGIEHLKIDPATLTADVSVIGNIKPKGICGSGLIDLVAEMHRVGIIDFVGKFVTKSTNLVRKGKWGLEYQVVPAENTEIGKDIVITQSDLDYVIDSKAAVCGAITVLMKKLKINIRDVKQFYLAGAFGNYTNLENAFRIGIFPELPNAETHPIGNGSLSGSYATLLSMKKRDEAKEISEKMVYVDLLLDTEFMEEYSKALYIPGSREYFPSFNRNSP